MPLVTLDNIHVQFGSKTILTDVHLSVHQGEIVTLIGPNGAGKSTLVKVVLGLLRPKVGVVWMQAGIRLGYMPQGLVIEPYMPLTVRRFLQLVGNIEKTELQAVLQALTISHLQDTSMESLSGGERQRVLLARALLRKPDLLILDEPVQGVDVTGQEELYRIIMQIRDQYQCGILMVSHDLHLVMAGTDAVICLNKHVCCSGSPAMVSQHPEFLNLFGAQKPVGLTIYTHQHNHLHDGDADLCS